MFEKWLTEIKSSLYNQKDHTFLCNCSTLKWFVFECARWVNILLETIVDIYFLVLYGPIATCVDPKFILMLIWKRHTFRNRIDRQQFVICIVRASNKMTTIEDALSLLFCFCFFFFYKTVVMSCIVKAFCRSFIRQIKSRHSADKYGMWMVFTQLFYACSWPWWCLIIYTWFATKSSHSI